MAKYLKRERVVYCGPIGRLGVTSLTVNGDFGLSTRLVQRSGRNVRAKPLINLGDTSSGSNHEHKDTH